METPNQPLDSVSIEQERQFEYATSGQRLLNMVIDYGAVIILTGFIGTHFFSMNDNSITGLLYGLIFSYYTVLEYAFGITLGKLVTNTRVVREDNLDKINMLQAFGRTLSRFVPLEPFSFIGNPNGWHDRWNHTIVVKTKNFNRGSL